MVVYHVPREFVEHLQQCQWDGVEVGSAQEPQRRYLSPARREALRRDALSLLSQHPRGGVRQWVRECGDWGPPTAPPRPPRAGVSSDGVDGEAVDPVELYLSALRGNAGPLAALRTVAEVLEVAWDQAGQDVRRGAADRIAAGSAGAEVRWALAGLEKACRGRGDPAVLPVDAPAPAAPPPGLRSSSTCLMELPSLSGHGDSPEQCGASLGRQSRSGVPTGLGLDTREEEGSRASGSGLHPLLQRSGALDRGPRSHPGGCDWNDGRAGGLGDGGASRNGGTRQIGGAAASDPHAREQAGWAAGENRDPHSTRTAPCRYDDLDVHFARSCDTLAVKVCKAITGQGLADSLKRMCAHSPGALRSLGWPALVTHRLAQGIAALAFGTGPHDIGIADCVPARAEDFDSYRIPEDDELEARQQPVVHMATWFERARCEISMIELVLGVAHGGTRRGALAHL